MFKCSTMKRLIWLKRFAGSGGGGGGTYKTVSGILPITLSYALDDPISRLIRYGKCEQASTPTPDAPSPIVCNNGSLVLSKNLFSAEITLGGTITNSGADGTVNSARARLGYQYLPAGTYTISTTGICNNVIVWGYTSTAGANPQRISEGTSFVTLPCTFTLSAPCYVRAMCRQSSNPTLTEENIGNWQIECGEDATEYVAHGVVFATGDTEVLNVAGQTATVETLLGAESYADEQDIISGEVTRRLSTYVVTGEESLTLSSSGRVYFAAEGTVPNLKGLRADVFEALCTHFSTRGGNTVSELQNLEFVANGAGSPRYKNGRLAFRYDGVFTTAAAAQEWFANQYAAGTPVIVVYTVRIATEETVAAQPLNTIAGDNIVDTEANVSNVTAEITFTARRGT